ncbi:hypothetical protein Trydic_g19156 [Trypoxylus dichotomus]
MEGCTRIHNIYAVLVIITLCFLSLNCKAQVTFSRDWNAGKRAADNPDLQATIKSATALCHLLITQIRQIATCETRLEDTDVAISSSYTETR